MRIFETQSEGKQITLVPQNIFYVDFAKYNDFSVVTINGMPFKFKDYDDGIKFYNQIKQAITNEK